LFADFTICPTEPYKQGAAQPAIVKKVVHIRVVPEWPPPTASEFVKNFYEWYTPRALPDDTAGGWKHTLDLIRWDLSDHLAMILKKGIAVPANCRELIRLDFDPFLYSREPGGHYKIGNIHRLGKTYEADIFRVENGKQRDKPDVMAEFRKYDEHWVFVNFHYPSGSDLVSILRSQAKCSMP
jgi:hypothetical protein